MGVTNENLLWVIDELPSTFVAIVILLAVVNMAVLFGMRAIARGAMDVHG